MDIKTNIPSIPTKVPEQSGGSDATSEDLNKEYVDKRTIVISLVHNYSNYRKVNMKVLGQRKETIGSSITLPSSFFQCWRSKCLFSCTCRSIT